MDNLKGMAWMTLAMLAFALTDMILVFISRDLPLGQVLTLFGLGGALAFGVVAKTQGHRWFSETLLTRAVATRNFAEAFATVSFVAALTLIPLSTLSAIIQANPLLVTLGAALFFGEKVGWRRWLAIFIGLGGVLVIIRPGADSFELATLLAVLAVIGLSMRDLTTRAVPRDIPTSLLASYGFAAVAVAGAAVAVITGEFAAISGPLWALLAASVAMGMVAYYAITAAMRVGEIAAVTPFRYTRLVFAFVIAWFVFSERPDLWTWVGVAIVIATGLYTFWREALLRRQSA